MYQFHSTGISKTSQWCLSRFPTTKERVVNCLAFSDLNWFLFFEKPNQSRKFSIYPNISCFSSSLKLERAVNCLDFYFRQNNPRS